MDMPTSYDGTLLDHLAEHMVYLSAASSFWFSLNSSYDHGCHLSKRLGMSPQDYEYLLVAANLAQFHPKWGFSIKILKWAEVLFYDEKVDFDSQNADRTEKTSHLVKELTSSKVMCGEFL